jgi:FG-GAP-like repeat
MNRLSKSHACRGVALAAAVAASVAATAIPKTAHANVVSVAMTAISVAQQLYSAVQWIDCKYGMSCPETDAHAQASRVITEVLSTSQDLDNNNLIGQLQGIIDRSDVHFRNPKPTLTYDVEESTLFSDATTLFDLFERKLNNTDATVGTAVTAAYSLTPFYIIMAATLDGIGKATLAHGRISVDLMAINDKRSRSLQTLDLLVGAQSLWYACSATSPADSAVTIDHSFATRKLWRQFADVQFYLDSCDNNCNLSRHYDASPTNVCKRDCGLICIACFPAVDSDVLRIEVPKAITRMNQDPVVRSVRADMEMLVKMGSMHNSALLWKQTAGPLAGLYSAWDVRSSTSYREAKFGTPSSAWQPVVTGDFDGDGNDDIFWADKTDGLLSEWNLQENLTIAPGWGPGGAGSLPTFMSTFLTNKSKAFAGDLDGDGVSDIVFATTKLPNGGAPLFGPQSWYVTWFMQAGTIVPKMTSTSSALADPVVGLGNFDGDALHRSDILFRSANGTVTMLLSTTPATSAPVALSKGGATVGAVSADWVIKDIADFNADGKSDILWYNTTTGQPSIWFMSGTTILNWPGLPASAPSGGWRIQGAADIDHDGVSDIVWEQTNGNLLGGGPVSAWIMNADTTIRAFTQESVPAGAQLVSILKQGPAAPANLPNATILEPFCGNSSGTMRNPGFASYETWQSGATFDGGHGTLVGDVNGDGMAEVITLGANSVTGMNLAGSSFSAPSVYWGGAFYGSHGTFLADVDGDGAADLVGMGDGYVGLILSVGLRGPNGNGQFGGYRTMASQSFFGQLGTLMGDVDGDGKADIVSVNTNNILMRRSLGTTLSDTTVIQNQALWSGANFLVDVDGDGKADLVTVTAGTVFVSISVGTWLSNPVAWSPPGWFLGTHGATMADIDGDGRADLIMSTDGYVSVLRSTGSSFAPEEIWSSGGPFYGNHGTFAADFDGNARADLIGIGDGYVGALRSQ